MLKTLLQRVYEPILRFTVEDAKIGHILLVLTSNDIRGSEGISKLKRFIKWSFDLSIHEVGIYISMADDNDADNGVRAPELMDEVYNELESIDARHSVYRHGSYKVNRKKDERCSVEISIGLGGRDELVYATRAIMDEVAKGIINPERIDDMMIESKLIFKSPPDLIIRSGKTRLTDFLIWQAVYSELYFTDVNWTDFRRIDLLRAIRDFKDRERRFGR